MWAWTASLLLMVLAVCWPETGAVNNVSCSMDTASGTLTCHHVETRADLSHIMNYLRRDPGVTKLSLKTYHGPCDCTWYYFVVEVRRSGVHLYSRPWVTECFKAAKEKCVKVPPVAGEQGNEYNLYTAASGVTSIRHNGSGMLPAMTHLHKMKPSHLHNKASETMTPITFDNIDLPEVSSTSSSTEETANHMNLAYLLMLLGVIVVPLILASGFMIVCWKQRHERLRRHKGPPPGDLSYPLIPKENTPAKANISGSLSDVAKMLVSKLSKASGIQDAAESSSYGSSGRSEQNNNHVILLRCPDVDGSPPRTVIALPSDTSQKQDDNSVPTQEDDVNSNHCLLSVCLQTGGPLISPPRMPPLLFTAQSRDIQAPSANQVLHSASITLPLPPRPPSMKNNPPFISRSASATMNK